MSLSIQFQHTDAARLSAKQLRQRYIMALSLIAILTISAQALMQILISDQQYDSRIVNIAGRQRMLSQKITKLAFYVANADQAPTAIQELDDALNLWQRSHEGLLHGDRSMGLPGKNSEHVMELFGRIQPHYEAIVATARTIVSSPGDTAALVQSMRSLRQHESEFLNGMNDIVFRYDYEANAKVEFSRWLEIGLMTVTLLVLALEAVFIFAPATRRIQRDMQEVADRQEELALLYEITTYLAEPASCEAVCKGVLQKLGDRLGIHGGVVRLVNTATRELEIVASSNVPDSLLEAEARLPMTSCRCGYAATQGVSVTESLTGSTRNITLLNNCKRCGYAAMAAIQICSKKQVLGVLALFFDDERVLAPNELRLLETIGLHLGAVIENLRLVVREKEMAVSEERNLLAQELHDSIAQSLAFLNIQAQMLKESLRTGQLETATAELALMGEGIQESYDNVRELLVHFRIKVDHAELDDAIRSALERFEGQTGVRTSFRKEGDVIIPVGTSAIQVLHIIQEALSNARKHSSATAVDVTMRRDAELCIAVRDNGKGFDLDQVMEDGESHVGIGIMRERAHRIGARLELATAPGRGTCVTLVLPV